MMSVFARTISEVTMGSVTSGSVTTVSVSEPSGVYTAYGSSAVYTPLLSSSCSNAVRFLPYSMTTPVFCPRCEWNFTVKLSHSNSPCHLESMEPSVPPRQARTLFGCVTENDFASE